MNLDFGIITCFFEGYETYISTWMQFAFPLYIWLLVLAIILASRYSNRISMITTSNTVSVLATLLLLSYAKLLKTSIEAASFTNIENVNDGSKYQVWILNGNIRYLRGKHIPLFLMSMLMTLVYLLPFTLLILLGPLLQAKSHYRFLNWINKLKPFLDAFYGPYTNRYRYWPGMLLLARVIVLGNFAFYSLGDSSYQLLTVSVMLLVTLAVWMLIGKTQATSLYQKRYLNYLELFFLLNLAILTVSSSYFHFTKQLETQQILGVVMVGSALATFCGIIACQIFRLISKGKLVQILFSKMKARYQRGEDGEPQAPKQHASTKASATHTLVEISECVSNDELREPLLTD
jgi:hypothetical protein